MKHALFFLLTLLAVAGGVSAQSSATRLIEAGRAQLDVPDPDSAARLLQTALQPTSGATAAEQTRAFVLYGIAELMRENRGSARQAFRQALRLDPTLRIDSLAFFHGELQREFAVERAAMTPARTALSVDLDVPFDTTVSPPNGRLRITTKPSSHARVNITVAPADAPLTSVWSDSQEVATSGTVAWNLRSRDSLLVPAGRYVLRATAIDSLGHRTPPAEWVLLITRPGLDTTVFPPALGDSVYKPDSARSHPGSVWWLIGGAAGSVAVAAANSQGKGARTIPITVGVVIFFLTKKTREEPEAERNRELRAQDAKRRAAIAQANAHAKAIAPIRIQVEGVFR
jgi:hypothetical protein